MPSGTVASQKVGKWSIYLVQKPVLPGGFAVWVGHADSVPLAAVYGWDHTIGTLSVTFSRRLIPHRVVDVALALAHGYVAGKAAV